MSKQVKNNDMNRMKGIIDVLQDSDGPKPKSLYKYYAFNEWTSQIFKNNEIYFPSPELFNDPFDSKIRFIYKGSKTDRKRFVREWSEKHDPDLPRKERMALEKRIMKQGLDQSMAEGSRKYFMAARNRMGIFCMTEDRENILMWSHYAAKHTGFCVEFRTDSDFFQAVRPVEYENTVPYINLLESVWDTLITKIVAGLLTKSQDWSYEKEWRIVEVDNAGVHKYPSDALISVILGCRMPLQTKEQIKEWCSAREACPDLYEAREKEQEFGLDIAPIS